MKKNLLLLKIQELQKEYHDLLLSDLSGLESSSPYSALDEICLFWNRNIKLVQLFLKHYISNSDYVFTAGTFLDYQDNEHYPFILLGNNHLIDDPLCAYAELFPKIEGDNIAEELLRQIVLSAKDNIRIIENCENKILILPLRILNQRPREESMYELGEAAFLSLFEDVNSINDVVGYKTIDEVLKHLKTGADQMIIFSENDNLDLPFVQRFELAMKSHPFIECKNSDGYNFVFMIYSFIQQSIDVVVSCVEYGCTPYLRYPVAFHYANLLLENIAPELNLDEMKFKMYLAHLVYVHCDKEKLNYSGFHCFLQNKKSFEANLLNKLNCEGINEKNINMPLMSQTVKRCLEEYYDTLKQ